MLIRQPIRNTSSDKEAKPRTYTNRDGEERQTNDVDRFYDYDPSFFSAEDNWTDLTGSDDELPFC